MKKIKIYSLLVFFLFVFLLTACSSQKDIKDDLEEERLNDEVSEQVLFTNTKDLLNKGEPLYCRHQMSNEEFEISSKYYFDSENQRMRSDSEAYAKDEDLTYNSSFIIKDGWAYMWNDLMIMDGMKFYLDETEAESESLDLEEELEFICQTWQVDSSIFELPDDINFSDMSELLNQLKDFDLSKFE